MQTRLPWRHVGQAGRRSKCGQCALSIQIRDGLVNFCDKRRVGGESDQPHVGTDTVMEGAGFQLRSRMLGHVVIEAAQVEHGGVELSRLELPKEIIALRNEVSDLVDEAAVAEGHQDRVSQ